MTQHYRFGPFIMLPHTRQLLRDGVPLQLGARAFDLLLHLIERREHVVDRDELMRVAWPATVVGDNNLNVQVSALRHRLGPQAVVTVAGRGYRFGLELETEVLPERRRTVRTAPLADASLPLPDKPSVAVLPFLNLGDDEQQLDLADGLTEDITTELSRFHELFVIARNSTLAYKDRAVDVRTVSGELGVRYVLEGSVRRAEKRVRVAAQLIDAASGEHIWAEKYDRVLTDLLDLQDDLTRAIVTAMAPQIDVCERRRARRRRTENSSAYALAHRGWTLASDSALLYDHAPRNEALRLAIDALALEPNCALALRTMAQVHWWHAYHNTTDSMADTVAHGLAAATRAIALDPADHHARRWHGQLLCVDGRPEEGLVELRQAHQLNPNCAQTLSMLGFIEATSGHAGLGVRYAQESLRLSPRDPWRAILLAALGFAHFAVADYEQAAKQAQVAHCEAGSSPIPHVLGAIAWVGVGNLALARAAFLRLNQMAPKVAHARLAGHWLSSSPRYLQRAQTFLRIAAGLEDPGAADGLR